MDAIAFLVPHRPISKVNLAYQATKVKPFLFQPCPAQMAGDDIASICGILGLSASGELLQRYD